MFFCVLHKVLYCKILKWDFFRHRNNGKIDWDLLNWNPDLLHLMFYCRVSSSRGHGASFPIPCFFCFFFLKPSIKTGASQVENKSLHWKMIHRKKIQKIRNYHQYLCFTHKMEWKYHTMEIDGHKSLIFSLGALKILQEK